MGCGAGLFGTPTGLGSPTCDPVLSPADEGRLHSAGFPCLLCGLEVGWAGVAPGEKGISAGRAVRAKCRSPGFWSPCMLLGH